MERPLSQGLCLVFKNSSDLPFLYARKPVKKLFNRGPATKIFEECRYGHPRSGKCPSPTQLAGTSFYRRGTSPSPSFGHLAFVRCMWLAKNTVSVILVALGRVLKPLGCLLRRGSSPIVS